MARIIVAWIPGLGAASNGLIMLAVPAAWYAVVPGVVDTGLSMRISFATSAPLISSPERR
jgi:hypothetical protein